jgi:hypothetical protein
MGLDPRRIESYNGMALAYLGLGRSQDAAVEMEERGLMEGFGLATLSGLAELYQKVPEGSCAVEGGQLNPHCPVLMHDLCRATADLMAAHREARMYSEARRLAGSAACQYNCQ